jgi:hypothetical protein
LNNPGTYSLFKIFNAVIFSISDKEFKILQSERIALNESEAIKDAANIFVLFFKLKHYFYVKNNAQIVGVYFNEFVTNQTHSYVLISILSLYSPPKGSLIPQIRPGFEHAIGKIQYVCFMFHILTWINLKDPCHYMGILLVHFHY